MGSGNRPLQIELARHDRAVVLTLSGSASMDACDGLHQQLEDLGREGPEVLVVDVTDLDFICSMGLGSIVAAHLRAQRNSRSLRLAGPTDAIRKLLEVTQLDTLFAVFDTPAAALAAS
ncbi:MAG: STAS domain-containing protein [bacterium]|nr:STAS domain-containing protein [bacterium]